MYAINDLTTPQHILFEGGIVAKQNKPKPNILIIWGNDIGWFNVSAYNHGIMGYRTPNIDRVAQEGCLFTDWYGQQSCTAGRAAFITGQSPIRTGLTKVGLPASTLGLQPEDPTIADMLKPLGYVTGQFGKNHLGDRDEFLPTAHGFDEFFGNLYHLNAEEEPENPDYPKDPEFQEKVRSARRAAHATQIADGTQKIEDTGPLTRKRMETVDEEFLARRLDFIDNCAQCGQAFLRLVEFHAHAHLDALEEGVRGQDRAGRVSGRHGGARRPRRPAARQARRAGHHREHHRHVLDRQRRRGHELARWRHARRSAEKRTPTTRAAGACPARSAGRASSSRAPFPTKSSRTPTCCPRWSRPPASPNIVEKLKKGHKAGNKTFKVHIDGYNLLPFLKGEVKENPRKGFLYWSDDGDLMALRVGHWKVTFMEQRAHGLDVWREPLVALRVPKIHNLRSDPFERGDEDGSVFYDKWMADRAFLLVPAQAIVGEFLKTFEEFPPRQKPASFSIDQALDKAREQQEHLAATVGGGT